MMRELSVFTGSEDIRRALGLLTRLACRGSLEGDPALELEVLSQRLCSPEGHQGLTRLARGLGLDPEAVPSIETIRGLLRDEQLSSRALRLHRGRNVYSSPKAALWRQLWLPFRDALTPDDETLALIGELISLRTQPGGADVARCVALLDARLARLGFEVDHLTRPGHAPLLVARRPARGLDGEVVMYGHYDVEDPEVSAWRTDPWVMTERAGRLYGVGIGDNKAALAHRLISIERMERTPALLWVIQGEEEIGSPLGHEVLGDVLADEQPTLWMEENGYFDPDGTQRLLCRTIGASPGSSAPPDDALEVLIGRLAADAERFGLRHRVEHRGLNKSFFAEGCPFNNAIPSGGRYLAIGLNDPASNIHRPDESVPLWTFPMHARQLATTFRWVHDVASRGRS